MDKFIFALLAMSATLATGRASAVESSAACSQALTSKAVIFVENGRGYLRTAVDQVKEIDLPSPSDIYKSNLLDFSISAKGDKVAALFKIVHEIDNKPVPGLVVRVYDGKNGQLLHDIKTDRTVKQVNILNRNGGVLALTFMENPETLGFLLDRTANPEGTTVGVDFFSLKDMTKIRTVTLARGWREYMPMASDTGHWGVTYSVAFESKGKYLAKTYNEYFDAYEIGPEFRLLFVRRFKYPVSSYGPRTEKFFDLMRTKTELLERMFKKPNPKKAE